MFISCRRAARRALAVAALASCALAPAACMTIYAPNVEVGPAEFPLALMLDGTILAGRLQPDGLALELCSASLRLRNDGPVAIEEVSVTEVRLIRAADGAELLALGGVENAPAEVGPSSQSLVLLEATDAGVLPLACGDEIAVEATAVAGGLETRVRGHATPVECP